MRPIHSTASTLSNGMPDSKANTSGALPGTGFVQHGDSSEVEYASNDNIGADNTAAADVRAVIRTRSRKQEQGAGGGDSSAEDSGDGSGAEFSGMTQRQIAMARLSAQLSSTPRLGDAAASQQRGGGSMPRQRRDAMEQLLAKIQSTAKRVENSGGGAGSSGVPEGAAAASGSATEKPPAQVQRREALEALLAKVSSNGCERTAAEASAAVTVADPVQRREAVAALLAKLEDGRSNSGFQSQDLTRLNSVNGARDLARQTSNSGNTAAAVGDLPRAHSNSGGESMDTAAVSCSDADPSPVSRPSTDGGRQRREAVHKLFFEPGGLVKEAEARGITSPRSDADASPSARVQVAAKEQRLLALKLLRQALNAEFPQGSDAAEGPAARPHSRRAERGAQCGDTARAAATDAAPDAMRDALTAAIHAAEEPTSSGEDASGRAAGSSAGAQPSNDSDAVPKVVPGEQHAAALVALREALVAECTVVAQVPVPDATDTMASADQQPLAHSLPSTATLRLADQLAEGLLQQESGSSTATSSVATTEGSVDQNDADVSTAQPDASDVHAEDAVEAPAVPAAHMSEVRPEVRPDHGSMRWDTDEPPSPPTTSQAPASSAPDRAVSGTDAAGAAPRGTATDGALPTASSAFSNLSHALDPTSPDHAAIAEHRAASDVLSLMPSTIGGADRCASAYDGVASAPPRSVLSRRASKAHRGGPAAAAVDTVPPLSRTRSTRSDDSSSKASSKNSRSPRDELRSYMLSKSPESPLVLEFRAAFDKLSADHATFMNRSERELGAAEYAAHTSALEAFSGRAKKVAFSRTAVLAGGAPISACLMKMRQLTIDMLEAVVERRKSRKARLKPWL